MNIKSAVAYLLIFLILICSKRNRKIRVTKKELIDRYLLKVLIVYGHIFMEYLYIDNVFINLIYGMLVIVWCQNARQDQLFLEKIRMKEEEEKNKKK